MSTKLNKEYMIAESLAETQNNKDPLHLNTTIHPICNVQTSFALPNLMQVCITKGRRELRNLRAPNASSFGNHPHLVRTYCRRARSSGFGLQPDSLDTYELVHQYTYYMICYL